MFRISTLVACLVLVASCSKPRGEWPGGKPEVDTVKARPELVTVSPALANSARVTKTSLTFPAEQAMQVMNDWPAGKVLLGNPGDTAEAKAKNPFGFLRKVKSVEVRGDEVVVETEQATLEEAVTGDLHTEVDLSKWADVELPEGTDLSEFSEPFVPANGVQFPTDDGASQMQPLETNRERIVVQHRTDALELVGDTFSVPERPIPVLLYDNSRIGGDYSPSALGAFLKGGVNFTPVGKFQPKVVIDFSANLIDGLKSAEFTVGGAVELGGKLEANFTFTPDSNASEAVRLAGAEYLKRIPLKVGVTFEKPLYEKMKAGTIGPVPVVSTIGLYLGCDISAAGGGHLKGQGTAKWDPTFGLRYDQDDKPKISKVVRATLPTPAVSGEIVRVDNAYVEVDCGLSIKVALKVAGAAGPYAQIRGAVVGRAEYSEICPAAPDLAPKDHRADANLKLGVRAYANAEVGAELSLLKGAVTLTAGPYEVWRREFKTTEVPNPTFNPNCVFPMTCAVRTVNSWTDLWSTNIKKPLAGLGTPTKGLWCQVQCDDQQKNGSETDVDCGGPNCARCDKQKSCATGADCLSGICATDNRCVASLCEDGLKGQAETEIDCGGPMCPACPAQIPDGMGGFRAPECSVQADCAEPAFCSEDDARPRTCTTDLCRDGRRSGSEPAIDCGSTCARKCSNGQNCNSGADCQSGSCNAFNFVCVPDSCFDGVQNGDEPHPDCGGTCRARCALTQGCRADADCESGLCSAGGRCVADTCQDGRVSPGEVGVDCGGPCSARCPAGERCGADTDCVTGLLCHARLRRCSMPGCDDTVLNGQESSVDCGGPTCSKCALSKGCSTNSDCVSNQCFAGRCISGPCDNGVKDPAEADVDCGPSCGRLCGYNATCVAPADCESGLCAQGRCASDICLDRLRDGTETDVDCGGPTCTARCATGAACDANSDCQSNFCNTIARRCVAGLCGDGLLTAGSESDVDCGGTCATKCAVNKRCTQSSDCDSTVCNATTQRCVPSTCFDGVRNGTETDLDCGGACEPKCAAAQQCTTGADCQSGTCNAMGRCASDQCSDGRLNGNESSIDCGGTCATKCAPGQGCLTGNDCNNPGMVGVAGFCSSNVCSATSCTTGVRDGTESGVDCGGTCPTCPLGQGCVTGADCASGICNATTRVCVATQCQDGVRNGTETDIDCGGSCGGTCALGAGCSQPWDCATQHCNTAGVCAARPFRSCYYAPAVDGLALIDTDGPRTQSGTGLNKPILTWCPNATMPGGFTPVLYLNSAGIAGQLEQMLSNYTKDNALTGPLVCNSAGFACPTAGDRCLKDVGQTPCDGTVCHCVGNGNWEPTTAPQLNGNPINYSSRSGAATADTRTFSLKLPSARRPLDGFDGFNSSFWPYRMRWTAYRDGIQVFDSGFFDAHPPPLTGNVSDWTSNGQILVGSYRAGASTWGWCQMSATYAGYYGAGPGTFPENIPFSLSSAAPFPFNDNESSTQAIRTREGVCLRSGKALAASDNWSTLAPSPYEIGALMRFTPEPQLVNPAFSGLWFGNYGDRFNNRWTPGDQTKPGATQAFMGICNQLQGNSSSAISSGCTPYYHPVGYSAGLAPFAWGNGENTGGPQGRGNYAYGSVFGGQVPGLVFVLWAYSP